MRSKTLKKYGEMCIPAQQAKVENATPLRRQLKNFISKYHFYAKNIAKCKQIWLLPQKHLGDSTEGAPGARCHWAGALLTGGAQLGGVWKE